MSGLDTFDHFIVLMLENRSFDHMLGYLSLPAEAGGRGQSDIDGLSGDEDNSFGGKDYSIFHLSPAEIKRHWRAAEWKNHFREIDHLQDRESFLERVSRTITGKKPIRNPRSFLWDPKHDAESVREQLADDCGDFIRNFRAVFRSIYPGLIMDYCNADELPVFDYLAKHYLVINRWFSSIPGPTPPNRGYAMSGTSFGDPQLPHPSPTASQVDTEHDLDVATGSASRARLAAGARHNASLLARARPCTGC